jgi:hypothetical protein
MDKECGTLELDSGLRLSLELRDYARQSVQLTGDDARRLGIALIELAGKGARAASNGTEPPKAGSHGT